MSFAHTEATQPIQVLTDSLRLLLRSAASPSQMSVMVVDVPPGGHVPPHAHDREEEGYFVLSGELSLTIGDRTCALASGGFGHVPPRTVHGYANRSDRPVRFLAWTVGGPIDAFFEAMSQRVHQMPEDAPVMAQLAQQYGVQMVPPGER